MSYQTDAIKSLVGTVQKDVEGKPVELAALTELASVLTGMAHSLDERLKVVRRERGVPAA